MNRLVNNIVEWILSNFAWFLGGIAAMFIILLICTRG